MLLLVPMNRLQIVPLGILPQGNFYHIALTDTELHHHRIYQPPTVAGYPRGHSARLWFSLHSQRVHCLFCSWQGMSCKPSFRLQFVKQSGTMKATLLGFCLKFVTGLQAKYGLSRKGHCPAPEKPVTFSGAYFLLRCFYEEFTGSHLPRGSRNVCPAIAGEQGPGALVACQLGEAAYRRSRRREAGDLATTKQCRPLVLGASTEGMTQGKQP